MSGWKDSNRTNEIIRKKRNSIVKCEGVKDTSKRDRDRYEKKRRVVGQ